MRIKLIYVKIGPQVFDLMAQGERNRHYGATQMNDRWVGDFKNRIKVN